MVPFLGQFVAIPKVEPHYNAALQLLNSKGMELKINNENKHFASSNLTVQALLDLEIPEKQKGIAIAINDTVIPKSNWNSHPLKETDTVLIISATQGG